MAGQEDKPAPWAVAGLFVPKLPSKCNAAIVDTVLLEGEPRWYFTSRNGEVTKKRTLTGEAVKERFLRLSTAFEESNPLRRTALLRFADGGMKIVDEEAFVAMMQNWPPREPGVQALQAYVPSAGQAGTLYRNSYKVISDKGRTATQTHSFTTIDAADAHSGNVQVGRNVVLSRSKAQRLNQTLDAASRSVVRFLESAHHVRILSAQVDYVVDAESQLWLSWIGDVTTVQGDAALDLSLAGLDHDKGQGRDSWLPRDARKTMEAEEAAKTAAAKTRSGSPKRGGAGSARTKRSAAAGGPLPGQIATKQVASAAEVAEAMGEDERLDLMKRGTKEMADDEERVAMGGAPATGDDPLRSRGKPKARQQASAGPANGGKDPHDGTYPNPFRSVGDFRKAPLRDPKVLELDEMGHQRLGARPDAQAMDAAEMEAALAGYDIDGVGAPSGMLGRKLPGGLDPDAVARMSYQSIARAREEGKKLLDESNHADSSNAEAWRE